MAAKWVATASLPPPSRTTDHARRGVPASVKKIRKTLDLDISLVPEFLWIGAYYRLFVVVPMDLKTW